MPIAGNSLLDWNLPDVSTNEFENALIYYLLLICNYKNFRKLLPCYTGYVM